LEKDRQTLSTGNKTTTTTTTPYEPHFILSALCDSLSKFTDGTHYKKCIMDISINY